MKVFICWSEERGRLVAVALHDWLKRVIQGLKPFLSTHEIRAGKRWLSEIAGELAETKFGILCLTAENLDSAWLNFEAGALSKTVDDKTYVCPYLIGGLQIAQVPVPLGQFQSNPADKEGTQKLLKTINSALADKKLEEVVLNDAFEKFWPDLEKALKNLPAVTGEEKPKRKVEDMVEEILDTVRGLAFMVQKLEERNPPFFPIPELGPVLPKSWHGILEYLAETEKRDTRAISGEAFIKLAEELMKVAEQSKKKEEGKKAAEMPK